MTPGGRFRHHVVVSIKKRAENEGRNVILALLSMGIGLKQVIVVDDDIDPFDPMQVDWAMATRFQADKDAIIIPTHRLLYRWTRLVRKRVSPPVWVSTPPRQ